MKWPFSICWFLICWTNSLIAQEQLFRTYTISDGLSNNAIRRIYQDANGFLWIATWEGLSKYDGHQFTNYTTDNGLPHSMVNDITEISPNVLIVALNDGSISIIEKGKLTTLPENNFILNRFYHTRENGLIAISDKNAIIRINAKQVRKADPTDLSTLYELIETKKGDYLAIADRKIVIRYDENLKPASSLKAEPLIPNCMLEDHSGNLWVGTESGLKVIKAPVSISAGTQWSELPLALRSTILPGAAIYAIYEDEEMNMWFGTTEGLFRVSPKNEVEFYTEKDGLPSRKITAIFPDREKNLWIGTYAGLAKLTHPAVRTIRMPDEASQNHTYSIHKADDNHFIVISNKAVFDYDKRNGKFRTLMDVRSGRFPSVIPGYPQLTVLLDQKTYTYDAAKGFVYKEPLASDGFFCSWGNSEFFAYGYYGGVVIVNKKRDTLRLLPGTRVNNLLLDRKNRLWVGNWQHGLLRYTIDFKNNRLLGTEDLTGLINDDCVRSLFEDSQGNVWVGTRYNGLTFFPSDEKAENRFHLNHRDGLISNWVYCFGETEPGNIWVSSLGGINKIIIEKGSHRVFNFSQVNHFFATANTMVTGGKNEIWCNSDKGIFRIQDNFHERMPPMKVHITKAQLGTSHANYAQEELRSSIALNHKQNTSHFEFTAAGLINEKELKYSYRLIGGSDTNWSPPSNNHSVQYASLNPGNYQFEVRMMGWNEEYGPVSIFPFRINPPLWQTTWFRIGVGFLILLIFYAVYRYRIRQLMRVQNVRNHIATDLHDDIGSSLTNISILSQLSLSHLDKPKEAKQFLSRITDQVQSSNEALDDIIWSVNSRHDSFTETLARMRRYAGDLFDHSPIVCKLDFDETGDDIRLGMEQRRDLFLIYKELLNNARKHADASNIEVQIRYLNKKIRLVVTDNGRGFDLSKPTDRNGLKNLQVRASRWKGEVNLQSEPGKGSTISISIPVLNKNPA